MRVVDIKDGQKGETNELAPNDIHRIYENVQKYKKQSHSRSEFKFAEIK